MAARHLIPDAAESAVRICISKPTISSFPPPAPSQHPTEPGFVAPEAPRPYPGAYLIVTGERIAGGKRRARRTKP